MATITNLDKLRSVSTAFPYSDPIRYWKEQGKLVMGWVCTYTPEELIYAAGILPVRITGGDEPQSLELANSYLYPTTCSTVRCYIQMALDGKYDFLDGFIMGGTCDHIRRLYDVWQHQQFTKFNHLIRVPGIINQTAEEYFMEEMADLRRELEKFTGRAITDESLREAITIYNRTRILLRELNDMCKLDNPPMTGAEILEVVNAANVMPRNSYTEILADLVAEVRELVGKREETMDKPRIMIYGSEINNYHLLEFLEQQGCTIVVQDTCTGYRYWCDLLEEDSGQDPLLSIAKGYFNHFPCSRMFPRRIRLDRVAQLTQEYRVDGLVSEYVRYCTPIGWERPLIRDQFEMAGIPVMQLELEYGTVGTAPVKTRIRAFVEMLEEKLMEE